MLPVFLVILAGIAVRFYGIRFGLPYKWADDAKIFYFSNIMLYKGDPIPDYFMYSSISMYIQSLVMLSLGWVSKLLVSMGLAGHTVSSIAATFLTKETMNYQLSTEFAYYSVLIGKGVFTLFNVMSGYFVYKILKRCTGSSAISLAGLLMNAFLFLQYQYSLVLRQESLSLFFLAAMAYLTIRLYDSPGRKKAILLGAVSALCATTEYSLAILLIIPVVVYGIARKRPEGPLAITPFEKRYRLRQVVLLCVAALVCYCALVVYIAGNSRETLLYFLSIKYRLAAMVGGAALAIAAVIIAIYKIFIQRSAIAGRISTALVKKGCIPYYFLYGFIPVAVIFNLGLFVKFYHYGYQVFIYLLGAYTKSFRIYTIDLKSMLNVVRSYIFNEQMGPVYTVLALLSVLVLFNKRIEPAKRRAMGIIFSFVALMFFFLIFFIKMFYTHRFIAISSLQVCIVALSLYNIYLFLKEKNRLAALLVTGLLIAGGIYPHARGIARLASLTREPDTRTLAYKWLGERIESEETVAIDKALCMDSVDMERYGIRKAVFMNIDKQILLDVCKKDGYPKYVITTQRKMGEEEFDRINRDMHKRYILPHLVHMPLFIKLFKESYRNPDFLMYKGYVLRRSFVKTRRLAAKESLYELHGMPRISVDNESDTPWITCNPDILIFERL